MHDVISMGANGNSKDTHSSKHMIVAGSSSLCINCIIFFIKACLIIIEMNDIACTERVHEMVFIQV